jgi:ubiquinone/menaquinone biosynthesis C-methylase UbiE
MEKNHVCPYWMGYFLVNPIRKLIHNPERLLGTYIRPGMIVIDYGSGMGYFSIPLARMVGKQGKVFCFDIQYKMLEKLINRARNSRVEEIIIPGLITANDNSNQTSNQNVDFTLLFAVTHEVFDKEQLFSFLSRKMKLNALLLFAEPRGYVNTESFRQSVLLSEKEGFRKVRDLKIRKSHAILLEKFK